MDELYNLPLIGDDTPSFTANTTMGQKGIGLSIDSLYAHIAWLRTIREKIEYKRGGALPLNRGPEDGGCSQIWDAPAKGLHYPSCTGSVHCRSQGQDPGHSLYPQSTDRNMDEITHAYRFAKSGQRLCGHTCQLAARRRSDHSAPWLLWCS
jgi:hypothetical protein